MLLSVLIVQAQKDDRHYKVLYMNNPEILIDQKLAHVGTTFSDNSIIVWAKDEQAMKVQDMANKKRYVMMAIPIERKPLTALQILTRLGHLSTHASNESVSPFEELENSFAPRCLLLDSIEIPTVISVDETHYFRGWYQYGNARFMKRLSHKDGFIIIDKTLFDVNEKRLNPRNIMLSIDYVDETSGKSVFIKDNIQLIIVPEKLP